VTTRPVFVGELRDTGEVPRIPAAGRAGSDRVARMAHASRKIDTRAGPGQLVTHRLTCGFAKSAVVASGSIRVLPRSDVTAM
jgi:hypothetical protein